VQGHAAPEARLPCLANCTDKTAMIAGLGHAVFRPACARGSTSTRARTPESRAGISAPRTQRIVARVNDLFVVDSRDEDGIAFSVGPSGRSNTDERVAAYHPPTSLSITAKSQSARFFRVTAIAASVEAQV
jgi:hypothetical protein